MIPACNKSSAGQKYTHCKFMETRPKKTYGRILEPDYQTLPPHHCSYHSHKFSSQILPGRGPEKPNITTISGHSAQIIVRCGVGSVGDESIKNIG